MSEIRTNLDVARWALDSYDEALYAAQLGPFPTAMNPVDVNTLYQGMYWLRAALMSLVMEMEQQRQAGDEQKGGVEQ